MPRRNWLPLLAAIGLAIGAYSSPVAYGQGRSGNARERQPQIERTAPQLPPVTKADVERIAKALEAANAREDSAKEEKRAQDNLDAQRAMAKSAGRMFWVGLCELITTMIGVALVGWTLHHTREAAKAARDSVKIAERSLSDVERPTLFPHHIRYFSHKGELVVGVSLKNYGRTAAILDLMHSTISIVVTENKSVRAAQERTDRFPLTEMLADKDELPEILIRPDPPIKEFAADIDAEKLTLNLMLGVAYRSLAGDTYDLHIFYNWSPSENRFIRENHSEQKNSKFRIPRNPRDWEQESQHIKNALGRFWEII